MLGAVGGDVLRAHMVPINGQGKPGDSEGSCTYCGSTGNRMPRKKTVFPALRASQLCGATRELSLGRGLRGRLEQPPSQGRNLPPDSPDRRGMVLLWKNSHE